MMENQAQHNRQLAGVQDPPKGTYGDTWTGGETTPPTRPSSTYIAKNPVTRPQTQNQVQWTNSGKDYIVILMQIHYSMYVMITTLLRPKPYHRRR